MSLLATPAELTAIVDVESARAWAELPEMTWRHVDSLLGGVTGLRVLATLPKGGIAEAVNRASIPVTPWSKEERRLTPVEMAQVALMWRVARQKFGIQDEDPFYTPGSKGMVMAATGGYTKIRPPPSAQRESWEVQRPQRQPNDPVVLGYSISHGAEFNTLLTRCTDCVVEVPQDRWDHEQLYDPDPYNVGTIYTKHASFIDGWDDFDGTNFDVSKEVEIGLDPQQKMCLKVGAQIVGLSGLSLKKIARQCTGVYVGIMTYDWYEFCIEQGIATMNDQPHMMGNRLSFTLGLQGPSTTIDTACSSSLVAANDASQAVKRTAIDYGMALGVCHMSARKTFVGRCAGHLLSATGRSFTFNSGGDGYCRGESYGGMVFGRRKNTKKTGCAIMAGSAVNEDGKSATMVAPHGLAQQELLKIALRAARLTPAEISCQECAANGSALGDPIEFGAMNKVQIDQERNDAMVLTAGKSNKGHTEGASGMTGLIKCALMLENGTATPIAHMKQLNADINDEDSLMLLPSEAVELFCYDDMKVGVSSFGFGGTNAHAILIEGSGLSSP